MPIKDFIKKRKENKEYIKDLRKTNSIVAEIEEKIKSKLSKQELDILHKGEEIDRKLLFDEINEEDLSYDENRILNRYSQITKKILPDIQKNVKIFLADPSVTESEKQTVRSILSLNADMHLLDYSVTVNDMIRVQLLDNFDNFYKLYDKHNVKEEKVLLTEEEKEIMRKAENIKLKMAMMEQEEQTDKDLDKPSQKILPILNIKVQYHSSRLETLKDKRDTLTSKIEKNNSKIEKLTAKADRLDDMNKLLLIIAPNMPSVKAFIERNEKKIKAIRKIKIPNRQEKITAHKARIAEIDKKSAIITNKFNRCLALNEAITSFALIGAERREAFAKSMNKLRVRTYACIEDKHDLLKEIIKNNPDKAEKLTPKLEKLRNKIDKIMLLTPAYDNLNNQQIDKAMQNTISVINNSSNDYNVAKMAENIVDKNIEDIDLHDIDKLTELKKQYPELSKISTMIANLENEVDNLKKTVSNQKHTEKGQEKPQAEQSYKEKEQAAIKAWHELGDAYIEAYEERQITVDKDIHQEKQNKSEIINPDYYKSISPDERIRNTYSKAAGEMLIENLKNSNIPYSAAINNEKAQITITVSKENESKFNELKQQLSRQRIQSYNPEYFNSLPKDKRFVQTGLTEQEVKNLKSDLDKQGIKCSFIQNGDNSKITISKDDTHKLNEKTKMAFWGRNTSKNVDKRIQSQRENKERSVKTRSRSQQEL